LESLRSDPDIGGEKFSENQELALKALKQYFGDEFSLVLQKMNLTNYPLLFKGLVRIGRASQNDAFVHPGTKGKTLSGEKTFAEALYEN